MLAYHFFLKDNLFCNEYFSTYHYPSRVFSGSTRRLSEYLKGKIIRNGHSAISVTKILAKFSKITKIGQNFFLSSSPLIASNFLLLPSHFAIKAFFSFFLPPPPSSSSSSFSFSMSSSSLLFFLFQNLTYHKCVNPLKQTIYQKTRNIEIE